MAIKLIDILSEAGRIPRKKGQRRNSKKHSDLYTDENPKGTIHGLKFATVKDAEASVRKIKSSGRKHAHKVQAAVAMEQRAKAAGKKSAAAVYRKYINSVKKSEGIVSEAISKNNIQSIIDRILPQIIDDKGTGRQGIPKIELHADIIARYSGIPDMRGEESKTTKAEWVAEDNTIYIYYPNMVNEEDVIRSVLHEYEHSLQDPKQNEKYREKGYVKNPNEIAARKAELDWEMYSSMNEIDYQARLSRGHQPDYYQLGTSEFKPFDKSRDDVEENFADGKKPGRKGISKRVGIPKGATLTQLAKLAKSKGEKGRMARWQLNMRRGKKKKKS